MSQDLARMSNEQFLAMVSSVLEKVEQINDDPASSWTIGAIKDEMARRISGTKQGAYIEAKPVSVEMERGSMRNLLGDNLQGFAGNPFVILVTGTVSKEEKGSSNGVGARSVRRGFFTQAETDAYLDGLRTMRELGCNFESIPRTENVPKNERENS